MATRAPSTLRARPLAADEQQAYAAVRLHAVHALMPYLATAVFRLRPWAVDGLATFGVDAHWRVLLDPEVLDRWGVTAAAGVLLHEVGHALRDHADAAGLLGSDLDHHAWNLCADAAINDDLVDAGIELPGRPVLPSDLHDRDGHPLRPGGTALAYYESLPVVEVGPPRRPDGGPDGVPAAGDGRPPGTAGAGAASLQRVPGRRSGPAASCGEVAGGTPHPVRLPEGADGVSAAEQRLARRSVASAVRAVGRGSGPGDVPAGLRRWADDELAPPQVSWRQLLRGAVRRGVAAAAGASDPSYARPSRRRVPGVVLPGWRRPVPTVACVVDTSASMSSARLHAVLGEVEQIARQVGVRGQRLRVLTVDAAVQEVRTVRRAAEVVLRGGGGTDLTPGLEAAVAARPRPDVVVVCTDGLLRWPERPPDRRCRWIVVRVAEDPARGASERPDVPAWAEVVDVTAAPGTADTPGGGVPS